MGQIRDAARLGVIEGFTKQFAGGDGQGEQRRDHHEGQDKVSVFQGLRGIPAL